MLPPKPKIALPPPNSSLWNSGVFDCNQDCGSFILGSLLPCVQYGRNLDILKKKGMCKPTCAYCCMLIVLKHCTLGARTRIVIRRRYGIVGDTTEDCLLHCCCVPCALSQEYREVKKRDSEKPLVVVEPVNEQALEQNEGDPVIYGNENAQEQKEN